MDTLPEKKTTRRGLPGQPRVNSDDCRFQHNANGATFSQAATHLLEFFPRAEPWRWLLYPPTKKAKVTSNFSCKTNKNFLYKNMVL